MASSMVYLLRAFRDDIARQRLRIVWRLLAVCSAAKIIGFAGIIALLWLALSHGALGLLSGFGAASPRTLLSNSFEAFFYLQLLDFYVAMCTIGPSGWTEPTMTYSRALLGAVATRDPSVTYAMTEIPVASAEMTDTAQTLGPLTHPMRALALNRAVYVLAALAGVGFFGIGVVVLVISLSVPPSFHQPVTLANWFAWLTFPCVLLMVGVAIATVALVARRFAALERAAITAQVDAEGVTFVRAGRVGASGQARRLRWSDARGFARIAFTDELGRVHECFVLSAADEDFLWEALYARPGASAIEIQREEAWRVAAHRLVEQVAQLTGLPLLDLSPTIAATLATNPHPSSGVTAWNLFVRARVIARRQGDRALARELGRRQGQMSGLALATLARLGMRFGSGVSKLTSAQREETLRLAQALLPYYPTAAQLTSNPRKRLLIQSYWDSELLFQLLVIVFAVAKLLSFLYWPFS